MNKYGINLVEVEPIVGVNSSLMYIIEVVNAACGILLNSSY